MSTRDVRRFTSAAVLSLALMLTGCGGDDDEGAMTVRELCDSLDVVATAFEGDDWPGLQRGWQDLGESRLPEEMPALAQEGVGVYAEFATRSDSMESYRAEVDQPSPEEAKAMVAVEEYYETACG